MSDSTRPPATTWRLQGLYVVAEIVIGLQASSHYAFGDHTVSELGSTSCRVVDGSGIDVCSPWHDAMNLTFVVFGLSLALGAWLLRRLRPAGRLATSSLVLWIVAGLASTGVGLLPVNEHGGLHAAVASVVFLAQPTALVLLGLALLRAGSAAYPRFAAATLAVGVLSAIGAIGFLILLRAEHGAGAFERLALWPGYLWVTVVAWSARAARLSGPVGSVPV